MDKHLWKNSRLMTDKFLFLKALLPWETWLGEGMLQTEEQTEITYQAPWMSFSVICICWTLPSRTCMNERTVGLMLSLDWSPATWETDYSHFELSAGSLENAPNM